MSLGDHDFDRDNEQDMAFLDALSQDIGALRRSSVALYGSGMISQGDHARIMLKIASREQSLMRSYVLSKPKARELRAKRGRTTKTRTSDQ